MIDTRRFATFSISRTSASQLLLGILLLTLSTRFSLCGTLDAFESNKLAEIDLAIQTCIQTNGTPGAIFWLERGSSSYHKPYGNRALVPTTEGMSEDTLFDAASLTKILATTPAILLLVERGKIELDAPAMQYLPEFRGDGKEEITVRQLLTHTSGLRPDLSLTPNWSGYDKAIQLACSEKLLNRPGTSFRYSDINFIVLGEIVHRVSGEVLNQFVAREIFGRLKMLDTGYLPAAEQRWRIAPTEKVGDEMLRGTVHDPTARRMGGVAGHAGVFTTAADLAQFCRMMLNKGEVDGIRLFHPETIELMTSVQTTERIPARRGLGWDIDSGYSRPRGHLFPLGSYGHTGFTGTCVWLDPFSKTFWILLSNRVHPDGRGNVLPLEGTLGTLAAEAVKDFDFQHVAGALSPKVESATASVLKESSPIAHPKVLNGIDVLVQEDFESLDGLKIGLITNHTGTDRERNSTIDLLRDAPDVELKVLFSPEHGIRGVRDEKVLDSVDEKTGLPVYSLYGERRAPDADQLRGLDALVFDIQDIGCRFYTYISTLGHCLEAAGRAKIKFFVLDRVNPINGMMLDGPVLTAPRSFTGFHEIPLRHGMTVGELAKLFNAERHFNAELIVIPVQGWKRDLWFDQTGLPWTNPSPNMRSLIEAMLYPGVGLLETANLSVGRGTGTPFEVVGAPYINDVTFADELNRLDITGARFIPIRFTPTASTFKDKTCAGVSILLTDREHCDVVEIGIAMAATLHRLYPNEFELEKCNRLLGDDVTMEGIKAGKSCREIRAGWAPGIADFARRRNRYLMYK